MLNRKKERLKYLIADVSTSAAAWVLFYLFRKVYLEPLKFGYEVPLTFDRKFFVALVLIPLFWINLYYLLGYYQDPYRKSRLNELGRTLLQTLIGVTLIFFAVLLDDEVPGYESYYYSYTALFLFHFILTFIPRFVLSSILAHKIHNRIIGFNTLIVGGNEKAVKLYDQIQNEKKSAGYKPVGYVNVNGNNGGLEQYIPRLGTIEDLKSLIKEHRVEEIIIALESSEHKKIEQILSKLEPEKVYIKIIPGLYDILSGRVRMTAIFGAPLVEVRRDIMPRWQQYAKRAFDVVVSITALILLSPLYLALAVLIKLDSKGPVFYTQERIGKNGKPFRIIKFRSMVQNAEKDRPQLASEEDPRITKTGKFMRKTRLDELPQFLNVLAGEMSLVGPRPERQYYIDQIVKRAPHYNHLLKVRPGITSWGQVKYGYAASVDEMIRRLEYDIIYIENMSLFVDFKILIYTVLIVLKGEGK